MTNRWAKRIEKLESLLGGRARPVAVFRYGRLRRLSEEIVGDRHIAIVKIDSTALADVKQCEFEERAGPALVDEDLSFHVYLNFEDENEAGLK